MAKKKKSTGAADQQHAVIGNAEGTTAATYQRTTHPDAQWFANAGLGLFLHWGISTVHGKGDLSWAMMQDTPWDRHVNGENHLPPLEYWKLAERFNPSKYEPEKWLAPAAAAGFTYAVLTSRHHDGYALWPTKHGEFSTATHMGGRDLIRPYVEACRRTGLKAGIYYSPPDWYYRRKFMSFHATNLCDYHEGMEATGQDWKMCKLPAKPEGFEDRYVQQVHDQLVELLSDYGKIDVLWFDGGPACITTEEIHKLQPGIVVNPRAHGFGDFSTAEGGDPGSRPTGWWERCDLWSRGGWAHTCYPYFSTSRILSILARTRAWGGNLLINAGPTADGNMPPQYFEKLGELTGWLTHSGESVLGTTPGCWPDKATVPVTTRGDTWYMHYIDPGVDGATIEGITKPESIKLLRTGNDMPYTNYDNGRLRVTIPMDLRTELDDVVVLRGVKTL
ncbi:MAG: alpha-L-fucosidase [Planctomycetaceae bacterium]|nr:alpha-L-fucosidase [Planctomycetaceae bacterium]